MKYFLAAVVVVLLIAGAWYYLNAHPGPIVIPTIPGTTSGTGTTTVPTGTQPVYQNATSNDIVVSAPVPGSTITSVVTASGRARGPWYFEATFPVVVEDNQGNVIGQGTGNAQSEWTTQDFVPFTTRFTLTSPYEGPGLIVFKKDNPSGDPSRDASISIPVTIQW